jgi:predicted TIM-barrel fold metal-dependent hydrolase
MQLGGGEKANVRWPVFAYAGDSFREIRVDRIIDVHCHLGDILEPGGAALIDRHGVVKQRVFDPVDAAERALHAGPVWVGKLLYRIAGRWVTRAERARNATATLENLTRSLDENGISHTVALPIPPYVRFDDLARAAAKEPRLLPFTGVDYSQDVDPAAVLDADVAAGARGLKLHPIIQNIPLTSPRTRAAVAAFSRHALPVLFHCGVSSYYLGRDRARERPGNGAIRDAVALVRDFPEVNFIAGHAGLFEVRDVIELLAGFPQVAVEPSFQSAATVRALIAAFGPERVLFGSDWPFGNRSPALAIARSACAGDAGLERRILFENAAERLKLD